MITGIIMASGFSRRMNRDKLTLNFGGELVIEKVIKATKESKLDEVILVYQNESIRDLGHRYNIKTVFNSSPEKGQSESMKLGIRASNLNTRAFMFIVGDQPLLDFKTINKIIEVFNNSEKKIIVPSYNGKKGSPTIFSSKLRDKLLEVEGDKGGRIIIKENPHEVEYVPIDDYKVGLDIDTWDEYQHLVEMEMKNNE
ncbi:Purine catabolism protein pucB [Proteiniborus sp. DW1]|uniref:molybdenum cofactor cytidylyltransferase n=1 Tax=Proteiniborus sp. DW1 TaxID=1889883 RepID=UPI00092DF2AC|nr:molybdenum cofactor cytidylyltransferase [Proteiniborus sp. DW1]SCG84511.1 Purine catabolism protein pucB [Proteiniborus sp. DW1]